MIYGEIDGNLMIVAKRIGLVGIPPELRCSVPPEANNKMQENFLKLKLKHQDESKKSFVRRKR